MPDSTRPPGKELIDFDALSNDFTETETEGSVGTQKRGGPFDIPRVPTTPQFTSEKKTVEDLINQLANCDSQFEAERLANQIKQVCSPNAAAQNIKLAQSMAKQKMDNLLKQGHKPAPTPGHTHKHTPLNTSTPRPSPGGSGKKDRDEDR